MNLVPESILIANIRLIGDVILTTPLIGLLHDAYPGAAIDLLVNPGTGEFLEKDPRVRTVIYSKGGEAGAGREKSGYQRRIFRSYDLAINMNASDRGNIASILAGRKVRLGFYTGESFWKSLWQRLLLTHPLRFPEDIPVARYCQVVAQTLNIPCPSLRVKIHWDATDQALVEGLLRERGVGGRFFVVHPFARWIYKYWSLEKFCAASDEICERYGLIPVWTSSPSAQEKAQLNEAVGLCRHRPVLLAGELTLNQMTCLLDQAGLYLGLDTAISHLAASTGTAMVALYGPTFTARWFPWYNDGPVDQICPPERGVLHRGNCVVLQADRECVPCGKAGCDDSGRFASPCIQDISVADVLAAVEICLAGGMSEDRVRHD